LKQTKSSIHLPLLSKRCFLGFQVGFKVHSGFKLVSNTGLGALSIIWFGKGISDLPGPNYARVWSHTCGGSR
jgi:hypothetical protein